MFIAVVIKATTPNALIPFALNSMRDRGGSESKHIFVPTATLCIGSDFEMCTAMSLRMMEITQNSYKP